MNMNNHFNLLKKNGIVLKKDAFISWINRKFDLMLNGEYTISVSKIVKQRSLMQNSLMWLYFACISHETGTDKDIIHDYYCTLFLSRNEIIGGIEKRIIRGTSKLNTIQFSDFLNKVQADAASEFGILLPNPDDLRWIEFEEQYKHFL